MSLCSWVNVVVGRMTAIDRAAKHVVLSHEEIVLYDHLILCTGQQYQVRSYTDISGGLPRHVSLGLGANLLTGTAAILSIKVPTWPEHATRIASTTPPRNPFQEKHSAQG